MSSEWESTDSVKGATGKRGKELETDRYQNEYSYSTLRTVNARTQNQQASHHFFLSASAVHQERSRRAGSCTTFGRRQLQFIRLGMCCSLWVVTPMSCSTLSVSSEGATRRVRQCGAGSYRQEGQGGGNRSPPENLAT